MIKWNDFLGIYRFFLGQKAIGWSKYICNLILTVEFNFGENLTLDVTPQIRGSSLTTSQPVEYSWMSGNPTPLTKIG